MGFLADFAESDPLARLILVEIQSSYEILKRAIFNVFFEGNVKSHMKTPMVIVYWSN